MLEKNLATRQAEKFVGENEPLRFTARNDFAFRLLFGSEENKEITMEFLSLVTNIDRALLKDIQMESPLLKKDYAEKKNGILDIKLLLQNGEKINVEMQNYWSPYFPRRSLYYWAKLYVEDFTQGAKYQRLMPCIVINIVNDRFPLSDKCHSVYQIMETGEHHVLDDVFEMHFLDLSKAREESQLGALKNWLVFIQTEDRKEREEMAKGNETLEKANEVMERFYSDSEARKQYEAALKWERDWQLFESEFERRGMEKGIELGIEQGIEQGIEKGIEKGIEQGIEQGIEKGIEQGARAEKQNIVENMKNLGYSAEEIERITGVVL